MSAIALSWSPFHSVSGGVVVPHGQDQPAPLRRLDWISKLSPVTERPSATGFKHPMPHSSGRPVIETLSITVGIGPLSQ